MNFNCRVENSNISRFVLDNPIFKNVRFFYRMLSYECDIADYLIYENSVLLIVFIIE